MARSRCRKVDRDIDHLRAGRSGSSVAAAPDAFADLDEWGGVVYLGPFCGSWVTFYDLNTASAPYPTGDVVKLLEQADG